MGGDRVTFVSYHGCASNHASTVVYCMLYATKRRKQKGAVGRSVVVIASQCFEYSTVVQRLRMHVARHVVGEGPVATV